MEEIKNANNQLSILLNGSQDLAQPFFQIPKKHR